MAGHDVVNEAGALFAAALAFFFVGWALVTGIMPLGQFAVSRSEHPSWFWFNVICFAVGGVVAALVGLLGH